jgi:hypothetical protein
MGRAGLKLPMNTKVAVGLIVLTAVGTYGVFQNRRHHFEPTKLGDGSILLDTETGVECSARFGMKWTDANKKVVWAAGLAAKKAETAYASYVSSHHMDIFDQFAAINQIHTPEPTPPAGLPTPIRILTEFENLYSSMEDQDLTYNALVEKAANEKVPDPDSSYFQGFPLCKNIR